MWLLWMSHILILSLMSGGRLCLVSLGFKVTLSLLPQCLTSALVIWTFKSNRPWFEAMRFGSMIEVLSLLIGESKLVVLIAAGIHAVNLKRVT